MRYLLLALASLALTGGTFLVVADPAELIRDRLVSQVQLRTGRDLVVKGGASLTLFPSLGVVMRDVAVSAARDASSPAVLRAKTVTARVAWWPLMEGRVAVRSLTLLQPVLDLAVDAEGRHNWDFAAIKDDMPAAPVRVAQLAPRFHHGQGLPPELYEALERSTGVRTKLLLRTSDSVLQEVRVTDATIRYSDARGGARREITGVDLRVGFGDQPTGISGSWTWASERVAIDGALQNHGADQAKLTLRVSARPFEVTWDGSVALTSASADLDGRITARAASAAALAKWMGKRLPHGEFDGPMGVDGRLQVSGATFELSGATITLDGTTATGSIAVEPMRQRPLIRANLRLPALDLDRLLASGVQNAGQAMPPPSTAGRAEPTGSIDDLLRRTEDEGLPASKGKVRSRAGSAWGSHPIDLGMLRLVDLAGKFETGRLSWREIKLGASRLNVTLDDGKLKAEVEDSEVYEGRGTAVLTMHQENSSAFVGLTASVDQATALPLMRDATGFDWVEGRGRLSLALTTQGASEREMAERLNGRAEFKVADGAVVGWNVTHMLRKLRQGQMTAVDRDPEAKTPFNEFAGSFTVINGVAANQDLKMTGPAVELTGAGTVVLPQRMVDYTVRPRLAIATAPQDNTTDPLSIEIPVRIHGSWAQPRFAADLQGALDDPRTAETVKQLGRQLRSGNVEQAVKGLLGDGPEAEEKAAKAKEFLRRFLKQ